MLPDLYWLDCLPERRLALMPRPRAGDWLEGEISGWRQLGLEVVVSLLEATEQRELGLQEEPRLCAAAGMEYLSHPIADRGLPTDHRAFAALIETLGHRLNSGLGVGVHCRAGIGRSALVVACLLGNQGVPPSAIFPAIRRARGVEVPDTTEQQAWALALLDARSPIR